MTEEGRVTTGSGPFIRAFEFTRESVKVWREPENRHRNWPVVYLLNNDRQVYVGESVNAAARMRQHLDNPKKRDLRRVRIVFDETFNKSACLDLESFLIRMFSGDGKFAVANRNDGLVDAEYYQRSTYQDTFTEVFELLRAEGLFDKRMPEIINSNLFKLSPFKALNGDQQAVIEDILDGLFEDLGRGARSTAVIEGAPGTGKTIVAIYLLKLLSDIRDRTDAEDLASDSLFSDFFTPGHPELLADARIGLVVPQQSLRASVKKVFKRTPGLSPSMVLTPYDVAKSPEPFDLLVVDETHRLTQYASQAMGTLTAQYRTISQALARPGEQWEELTQIDWILRRSSHQIFLLDEGQGVRPVDVPREALDRLRVTALASNRSYVLRSQMRVLGGSDYLDYVRAALSDNPPRALPDFGNYDLRFYDDAMAMYEDICAREAEYGLSRMLSGYAWMWRSKGTREHDGVADIEIGDLRLPWNRTQTDWINSPGSIGEVGSIHTVQGYDLNYAGVIIGRDLYYDATTGRIRLDRGNYFDAKGKADNRMRGKTYSDEEILVMVRNAYHVLLTRGIRGTYIYVCDPALREHLRPMFPPAPPRWPVVEG